jgi:hypothetical protein
MDNMTTKFQLNRLNFGGFIRKQILAGLYSHPVANYMHPPLRTGQALNKIALKGKGPPFDFFEFSKLALKSGHGSTIPRPGYPSPLASMQLTWNQRYRYEMLTK